MQNAVISGGSNGIGLAVGRKLVEEGYTVYALDTHSCADTNIHWIKTDVTNENSIIHALAEINQIDILVNNAGVMRRGTIFDSSEEDFDAIFNVNVKGSWLLLKNAAKKMKEGIIVQISSNHATFNDPDPGLYTLSKKAVADLIMIAQKSAPRLQYKVAFLGHVDTSLGRYNLSEAEIQKKNIQAQDVEIVADKIQALIFSRWKKLEYMHPEFKYS